MGGRISIKLTNADKTDETTPADTSICDFSRGVLNVRLTRSHPTLAPRSQIEVSAGVVSVFW